MPNTWSAPTFVPGVVWHDLPAEDTPVDAADLNLDETVEGSYAASVGQSVVNYFEGGNSQHGRPTPAYGVAVTPDSSAGRWQTVAVTNATAFTINAPTNPPDANHTREMTIEVFNNSGGAMGVITWNAIFLFAGLAWANPATGKRRYARFMWNGQNWVCTGIATADY